MCSWDHVDSIRDWTLLRSLCKLKILAGGCWDLFIFQLTKASLVSRFPCLLKLPLTSLERAASFFSLSLPPVYRGQFSHQQIILMLCFLPSMYKSNNPFVMKIIQHYTENQTYTFQYIFDVLVGDKLTYFFTRVLWTVFFICVCFSSDDFLVIYTNMWIWIN